MALQPGEVKTEHLANNAVTGEKIATAAVTVDKLQSGAVTTPKIATAAVTADKIPDGALTTGKFKDGAVTGPKIAASGVGTAKLRDRAVTTAKIANGAVTPAKLSFTPPAIARPITPAVVSAELGAGSVITDKIANDAVTPVKLAAVDTPANDEVPTYNAAQTKFEWKPMAGGVPAPGVYLLPATQVFYDEGTADLQQEVDLSALVPAGTTGVLIRAEHSAGVNMTTFAPLRVDGVGPADSFGVYLNDGDKYGAACSDNGLVSLYNPATRTIRVRAPRTGQYTYAIVYLLGYIK